MKIIYIFMIISAYLIILTFSFQKMLYLLCQWLPYSNGIILPIVLRHIECSLCLILDLNYWLGQLSTHMAKMVNPPFTDILTICLENTVL